MSDAASSETPSSQPGTGDDVDDGAEAGDAGRTLAIRPVADIRDVDPDDDDCDANGDAAADAPLEACDTEGDVVYTLEPAIATDEDLISAQTDRREYPSGDESPDEHAENVVLLNLTPEAHDEVRAFTAENQGEFLATVVDGRVVSAPEVQGAIPPDGPLTVMAQMSEPEAQALADRLN